MIHYQLRCALDHEFDGWFASSDAFETQAAQHLIACPECASTAVSRALMAPRLARKSRITDNDPSPPQTNHPKPPASPAPTHPAAAGTIPDALRAALIKMRAEVEKHCDYVGPNFAAEARKIHNGETPPRAIYGESTDAQAEALADDGIPIARIPWLPRADS